MFARYKHLLDHDNGSLIRLQVPDMLKTKYKLLRILIIKRQTYDVFGKTLECPEGNIVIQKLLVDY